MRREEGGRSTEQEGDSLALRQSTDEEQHRGGKDKQEGYTIGGENDEERKRGYDTEDDILDHAWID